MHDLRCCCSVSAVLFDADPVCLVLGWVLSQIQLIASLVQENTSRAHLI